jgi:hypothetical protein
LAATPMTFPTTRKTTRTNPAASNAAGLNAV